MSIWKEYLKPVFVLVLICCVVGLSLAGVNAMTASVIAENNEKAANETYFAALPAADHFTELECEVDGVTAVLKADNGAGYVITAEARGYGGAVPAAVAFDENGTIISVIMMDNSETPGLGKKVENPEFAEQFSGMDASGVTLDDIDAISGATISSKAATKAVNAAMEAFQQVTGGVAK